MQILKCGTKAQINGMDAVVTALEIRFQKLTYELSYWYQGEYKTVWLNETQFTTKPKSTQQIGFKTS